MLLRGHHRQGLPCSPSLLPPPASPLSLQLSRLARLRHLSLAFSSQREGVRRWYPSDEAALGCLTGLASLELQFCELPRSLSALAGLQSLFLTIVAPSEPGLHLLPHSCCLEEVLPRLQQLTCLALTHSGGLNLPPEGLAGLSRLQRLWICCGGMDDHPLPAGGWQRSLRWLAANWKALAGSRLFVEGAAALERLHILGEQAQMHPAAAPSAADRQQALGWFKRWAGGHAVQVSAADKVVLEALAEVAAASAGRLTLLGGGKTGWPEFERGMTGQWRQAEAAAWAETP